MATSQPEPWNVRNYLPHDADKARVAKTREMLEPIFIFLVQAVYYLHLCDGPLLQLLGRAAALYPDATRGHLEGKDKWPALWSFQRQLGLRSYSALEFFGSKMLNPFATLPGNYWQTHNFPGAFTASIMKDWYGSTGFWTLNSIHSGNMARVGLMQAEAVLRGDARGEVFYDAKAPDRTLPSRINISVATNIDGTDFNSGLLMKVDGNQELRMASNWFKAADAARPGRDMTSVDMMEPLLPRVRDVLEGIDDEDQRLATLEEWRPRMVWGLLISTLAVTGDVIAGVIGGVIGLFLTKNGKLTKEEQMQLQASCRATISPKCHHCLTDPQPGDPPCGDQPGDPCSACILHAIPCLWWVYEAGLADGGAQFRTTAKTREGWAREAQQKYEDEVKYLGTDLPHALKGLDGFLGNRVKWLLVDDTGFYSSWAYVGRTALSSIERGNPMPENLKAGWLEVQRKAGVAGPGHRGDSMGFRPIDTLKEFLQFSQKIEGVFEALPDYTGNYWSPTPPPAQLEALQGGRGRLLGWSVAWALLWKPGRLILTSLMSALNSSWWKDDGRSLIWAFEWDRFPVVRAFFVDEDGTSSEVERTVLLFGGKGEVQLFTLKQNGLDGLGTVNPVDIDLESWFSFNTLTSHLLSRSRATSELLQAAQRFHFEVKEVDLMPLPGINSTFGLWNSWMLLVTVVAWNGNDICGTFVAAAVAPPPPSSKTNQRFEGRWRIRHRPVFDFMPVFAPRAGLPALAAPPFPVNHQRTTHVRHWHVFSGRLESGSFVGIPLRHGDQQPFWTAPLFGVVLVGPDGTKFVSEESLLPNLLAFRRGHDFPQPNANWWFVDSKNIESQTIELDSRPAGVVTGSGDGHVWVQGADSVFQSTIELNEARGLLVSQAVKICHLADDLSGRPEVGVDVTLVAGAHLVLIAGSSQLLVGEVRELQEGPLNRVVLFTPSKTLRSVFSAVVDAKDSLLLDYNGHIRYESAPSSVQDQNQSLLTSWSRLAAMIDTKLDKRMVGGASSGFFSSDLKSNLPPTLALLGGLANFGVAVVNLHTIRLEHGFGLASLISSTSCPLIDEFASSVSKMPRVVFERWVSLVRQASTNEQSTGNDRAVFVAHRSGRAGYDAASCMDGASSSAAVKATRSLNPRILTWLRAACNRMTAGTFLPHPAQSRLCPDHRAGNSVSTFKETWRVLSPQDKEYWHLQWRLRVHGVAQSVRQASVSKQAAYTGADKRQRAPGLK
jgi:hypothetical protein